MNKTILHCDLNSFYASVECLYNPGIRDMPVAVCGSQSTRHGIVLAKNHIAKQNGVKTGEAIWEAKNKCPRLVVVHPNYSLYLKFSSLAADIYRTYTDQVESFGIDECWLDATESTKLFGDGVTIANRIKGRIQTELGLTVSVGVSYNKIFAKLGSDMKKPNAVMVITEEDFMEKTWGLPANNLMYVGPATARKLSKVGIYTIGDLAGAPRKFLMKLLGRWGETLWSFANGYDDTPVVKTGYQPVIKGIGNSLTTPRDLLTNEDVKLLFHVLADSVGQRLRKHNFKCKTIQISIRDSELAYIERQGQLDCYTYVSSEICEKAYEIFTASWDWAKSVRSLGIRATGLITSDSWVQLSLFDDERRIKRERLEISIDKIRERFGYYSVQRALTLKDKALNANPAEENIIHPVPFFR